MTVTSGCGQGTLFSCTVDKLYEQKLPRVQVRQSTIYQVLEAVAASGLHSALGGTRLLQGTHWETGGVDESHGTARSVARTVAVGVLTAALPLSVFGALFLSADPVFAEILGHFVRIDLASLASVRAAVEDVASRTDRLDVLVNNAGVVSGGPLRVGTA